MRRAGFRSASGHSAEVMPKRLVTPRSWKILLPLGSVMEKVAALAGDRAMIGAAEGQGTQLECLARLVDRLVASEHDLPISLEPDTVLGRFAQPPGSGRDAQFEIARRHIG